MDTMTPTSESSCLFSMFVFTLSTSAFAFSQRIISSRHPWVVRPGPGPGPNLRIPHTGRPGQPIADKLNSEYHRYLSS